MRLIEYSAFDSSTHLQKRLAVEITIGCIQHPGSAVVVRSNELCGDSFEVVFEPGIEPGVGDVSQSSHGAISFRSQGMYFVRGFVTDRLAVGLPLQQQPPASGAVQ